jgi:hypothetical protein
VRTVTVPAAPALRWVNAPFVQSADDLSYRFNLRTRLEPGSRSGARTVAARLDDLDFRLSQRNARAGAWLTSIRHRLLRTNRSR